MATVARYQALVARLEREAQQAPGRYKFKLALLAGLGFAVLGGTVLLALGMSVGLVAVLFAISPILLAKLLKVVWIPVAFGGFVLKALWVKFEPPEGHVLGPDEAPELRAEIERLRAQTGAPPLRQIVIDPDLNASAASVPRMLGLLGHTHYLVLGLPLMQLLSREQFAAVVAHEFGHFGGGHSRFAGWIYRVRVSWYRLLHELAQRGSIMGALFARFFNWYAPYFDAYSFVLARAQEYDADATAARVTGAPAMAQALQRVGLGGERLGREFWPALEERIRQQAEPPAALLTELSGSLTAPAEDEAARLQQLLEAEAHPGDTHPTLKQRLQALAQEPQAPAPAQPSAAEALLGPLAAQLQARFNAQWLERNGANWRDQHRQHVQSNARLEELDARADGLVGAEAAEYAQLALALRPDFDPEPWYRKALATEPLDALTRARLGALLLEREDARSAEGAVELERAIELDRTLLGRGLHLLEHHYRESGNAAAHAATLTRIKAWQKRCEAGETARNTLDDDIKLQPHGLEPEVLEAALATFRSIPKLIHVWIARKPIDDDSGVPHYVVLVDMTGVALTAEGPLKKVRDPLELPGSFTVFFAMQQRQVAKRVKAVPGSQVYLRDGK
ncbi:M48 family metalloprotease [Lysobacter silvisoli]|uniref:Peptidase M48 domain-containing protein n=1 Tax=Lysobacter silvisoli TaxID=2293254 RepID=A0A371JYQ4_9GAMM|nr:M48 family metalloprotease [Lysobacter silvisoli]RDZ26795.1 hypothetical protein DX914_17655 [Lysobacter silvisoli]